MKYSYVDDVVGIEIMDSTEVKHYIEDFEENHDIKFPEQYKKFMLKYNGGDTNNIYIEEDTTGVEILVSSFLSFNKFKVLKGNKISEFEYVNNYKLREQIDGYKKILPYKKIIMIGWDIGDNLLLISCEEDDYGQVFISDHEHREYFKIDKIANSFNEFISRLKHNNDNSWHLGREILLKNVKNKKELANLLKEFKLEDEELRKPIYRELKVEYYDT